MGRVDGGAFSGALQIQTVKRWYCKIEDRFTVLSKGGMLFRVLALSQEVLVLTLVGMFE